MVSNSTTLHNYTVLFLKYSPCLATNLYLLGFTEKQLLADPRLRLEQELRSKGLMHNDYARDAVKHMLPPQKPRKDLESNLFQ